jgi:hypothetical protein
MRSLADRSCLYHHPVSFSYQRSQGTGFFLSLFRLVRIESPWLTKPFLLQMRRWALAEHLRKRTRDWSPLPITSSTSTQLMRNYLDGTADPRETSQKDSPVLRWRLREIEVSSRLAPFFILHHSLHRH